MRRTPRGGCCTGLGIGLWFLSTVPTSLRGQDAGIEIRPREATVIAGGQMRFVAVVLDAEGREHDDRPVEWSTSPSDLASMDGRGVFYAHRQGRVRVVARVDGVMGVAYVIVEPTPAATVDLELDHDRIVVGGRTLLRATARTEDGEPLSRALFTFQSGDERVAVVDPSGVVIGRREGTAILAATSGRARREVRIRVIRNRVAGLTVSGPTRTRTGDVVHLRVIAEDERRLPVTEPVVRWSVSGRGASIDYDGGFVAEQSGTYLITVSAGQVAGIHSIRVDPRPRPRTLTRVGQLGLGSVEAAGMYVSDGVVYLATRSDRLYTIDIGDPSHPRLADSLTIDATIVHEIALADSGRIGIVARSGSRSGGGGLSVLDLTNPLHPRLQSDLPRSLVGDVHSVYVVGPHVYAAESETGWLRVIDIGDVHAPRLVGSWRVLTPPEDGPEDERPPGPSGRHLHEVHVHNGLAYLAYGRDGLVVLDVGNGVSGGSPETPRLVSRFVSNFAGDYPSGMRAGTHTVFPFGNLVFVGDGVFSAEETSEAGMAPGRGRVRVVDLSDPERPRQVAEYHLPERGTRSLWVQQDVLYVGLDGGGLKAVDVSGELRGNLLAQGREIGSLWTGSPEGVRPNAPSVVGVQHHQDLVIASDAHSGLWVVRLSRGEAP